MCGLCGVWTVWGVTFSSQSLLFCLLSYLLSLSLSLSLSFSLSFSLSLPLTSHFLYPIPPPGGIFSTSPPRTDPHAGGRHTVHVTRGAPCVSPTQYSRHAVLSCRLNIRGYFGIWRGRGGVWHQQSGQGRVVVARYDYYDVSCYFLSF